MLPDELESLLASTSLEEVIAAIEDPARQVQRGWDLRSWTYQAAPASVCFLHCNEKGQPSDVLVAVHAPEERRDRLAHLIADFPLPAKLVLVE